MADLSRPRADLFGGPTLSSGAVRQRRFFDQAAQKGSCPTTHCGFPQVRIVCQQIRGIPFECFSTRPPASSSALGGLIHKLTNTLLEANAVLDRDKDCVNDCATAKL